jgi:hypothetical protein
VPATFLVNGWAHLATSVFAPDGSFAFAVDSVRIVSAVPHGLTWATGDPYDEAPPSQLVLGPPPTTVPMSIPAGAVRPGEPYEACTPLFVDKREKGFRTVADVEVYRDWSFQMNYVETDSTAWEVGYEKSAGKWAVAGSMSFDQRHDRGYDSEFGPYPGLYQESFQLQLNHARVVWRCGDHRSPGPFYVRTVEPESWTGGTYNQGDPEVRCDPGEMVPVAANTTSWRGDGKSSKYSGSAGVMGFKGKASVTYSKATKLGWRNRLEQPRHICGESADPLTGRTRVTALPW